MLAETIELTTGVVIGGIFAIVGPVAIIGGGFVAWGQLRQTVKANAEAVKASQAAIEQVKTEQRDATERARTELDAHARVLADRIDAVQNHLASNQRSATQSLDRRIGSLERWRERMRGAEEARAAAVPRQVYDDTAPMSRPITTPRIHQSSTHYPAVTDDDEDR